MKDSQLYASMILSILSSSKDKQSALQAVQHNFVFQGTLRMEIEKLFETYKHSEKKLIFAFMDLVEQFHKNDYPYIAGISLKPTRGRQSHSS